MYIFLKKGVDKNMNEIQKMLYELADEQHNIWARVQEGEIISLYKPDPENDQRICIEGDDFRKVTQYHDLEFNDTPDAYKNRIITSMLSTYYIMKRYGLIDKLELAPNIKMLLGESEHKRRISWIESENGRSDKTSTKKSYLKTWREQIDTPFSELSLGLQYWDFDEVKKMLYLLGKNLKSETNLEYFISVLNELKNMMQVRNYDNDKTVYEKHESDLIAGKSSNTSGLDIDFD